MLLFHHGNLRSLFERIHKLLADVEGAPDPTLYGHIDNQWYQDTLDKIASLDNHREQILAQLRTVLDELNSEYTEATRRLTRDNRLMKSTSKVTRKSMH